MSLASLEAACTRGVELTTKGDFVDALEAFRCCLRSVCLVSLRDATEEGSVKLLMARVVEYATFLRIQLELKKLEGSSDLVRIGELACHVTLCQVNDVHRYLALKQTQAKLFKMGNFMTAGHFARQILALEPAGVSNPL